MNSTPPTNNPLVDVNPNVLRRMLMRAITTDLRAETRDAIGRLLKDPNLMAIEMYSTGAYTLEIKVRPTNRPWRFYRLTLTELE